MTSNLRLPITGFGAEIFFLFLLHEVHPKHTTFCASKGNPSTKLYHPRMVSSPRSLLLNPELQVQNNGKTPHMERQLDTGSVTLHLTINGLSRMSINPFASFNSPTVPDKPCVMKLTTLC